VSKKKKKITQQDRGCYVRFEKFNGIWCVVVYHEDVPKKVSDADEGYITGYVKLEDSDYDKAGEPLLAAIDRKYRSKLVPKSAPQTKIILEKRNTLDMPSGSIIIHNDANTSVDPLLL
jgi:hypothetical protein